MQVGDELRSYALVLFIFLGRKNCNCFFCHFVKARRIAVGLITSETPFDVGLQLWLESERFEFEECFFCSFLNRRTCDDWLCNLAVFAGVFEGVFAIVSCCVGKKMHQN